MLEAAMWIMVTVAIPVGEGRQALALVRQTGNDGLRETASAGNGEGSIASALLFTEEVEPAAEETSASLHMIGESSSEANCFSQRMRTLPRQAQIFL
mmetsp:Transcript_8128/g.17672  ORF Transcript_8128/g.17672 Transcript_8128/m.17672 type:complete len:97 (+) Transcript_8128:170-460(+)